MKFPYIEKESKILGKILRPLVEIEIFSQVRNEWEIIEEFLVDTGADLTVIPRYIGESVISDITTGEYAEIRGIVPTSLLIAFIHELRIRAGGKEFKTKVAIADSNDVPPILGRYGAIDLFNMEFKKGKEIVFTD